MADTDQTDPQEMPQIYLITPPELDVQVFPTQLSRILDAQDIACVRLALSTKDEGEIARAADACREITHAHDVALVIESHLLMVERLGLDGVHLTDGARSVRYTRKELGEDAIVGAFCGALRHDGMTAGETGADYVSFGPVGKTALGDGTVAETDLFQWWSEVIEVPVVAEGGLTVDLVEKLAPFTDFFGIGAEIWGHEAPLDALKTLIAPLR